MHKPFYKFLSQLQVALKASVQHSQLNPNIFPLNICSFIYSDYHSFVRILLKRRIQCKQMKTNYFCFNIRTQLFHTQSIFFTKINFHFLFKNKIKNIRKDRGPCGRQSFGMLSVLFFKHFLSVYSFWWPSFLRCIQIRDFQANKSGKSYLYLHFWVCDGAIYYSIETEFPKLVTIKHFRLHFTFISVLQWYLLFISFSLYNQMRNQNDVSHQGIVYRTAGDVQMNPNQVGATKITPLLQTCP